MLKPSSALCLLFIVSGITTSHLPDGKKTLTRAKRFRPFRLWCVRNSVRCNKVSFSKENTPRYREGERDTKEGEEEAIGSGHVRVSHLSLSCLRSRGVFLAGAKA